MYSYADRIRAVQLYIKLGKRIVCGVIQDEKARQSG